jgi:hypothetical protein
MHFLKCTNCGHLNEVKTEYLIFCSKCNKKLINNFSNWQTRNPERTFADFKELICISEEEVKKSAEKPKSKKSKSLKYWIGFAVVFAIFCVIGFLASEKLMDIFRKPVFDKVMVEYAKEFNKTCPMMVDNATQLNNVLALPENVLQYNYTIVTMVKDSVNINALKEYLEPAILNTVKTEPQMKIVRDNKVTVNYSYQDKNGVFMFTISIKPEQYE